VRKSPDKDAGEVLRRLTGLTVADGKYVFVRGLGERYSSTEVDGVRIASPEQNKRVVPLDLFPASLLDNVVIQKTYTADRPGEFGGGDVQVHTKDFPGGPSWQFSAGQGYKQDVTFQRRSSYAGGPGDTWGFGAGDRGIPAGLEAAAGGPLVAGSPPFGTPKSQLASAAKLFSDVWSPTSVHTLPNGSYAGTYGNEWKLLGHSFGLIASGTFARSFDDRKESQRLFASNGDTTYDYGVHRSTASAQLGALTALSYRFSPAHSLHLRGLFLNSADDEVRTYEGTDHNRTEATTGNWIQHRDTRLMYVQRDVLSGTLEGKDEFRELLGLGLDWKLTRSQARRQQPDRRETSYDQGFYYDANNNLVEYWGLGSTGDRQYGDLHDAGWGQSLDASVPYQIHAFGKSLGKGRFAVGVDHQTKDRRNDYRRFNLYANQNSDPTAAPESLFDAGAFTGGSGTGYVEESTLPQDNYRANSRVTAGYVSVDAPFGPRVRSNFGVRVERGSQDVKSYDLLHGGGVFSTGGFTNTDWLPAANLTVQAMSNINLRLAASRTLSRPDLNELSPSPALEYVAGYRVAGNPNLHRALIDNYDVRVEAYPGLSEVLAAGFFYKNLKEPIEQSIQGGVPPLLVPINSDHGRNRGVELEARLSLGRAWKRLQRFSINSNAAFINSSVALKRQITPLSDQVHPLQGQASYSINGSLGYVSASGATSATVLVGAVGRRLRTLGYLLPDIYDQPTTTLDATIGFSPIRDLGVKLSARNLTNGRIRQLQDTKEVSSYRQGRSVSAAISFLGQGR
jgi:TonB-dependent receptor